LTLLSAHISGYNNEIVVSTKDMAPGQNSELNAEKLPLTLASSTDKPSIVTSPHASQRGDSQTEKPADAQKLLTQASVVEELERPSHESTKNSHRRGNRFCHNLLHMAIINRSRGDQNENRCPQVFRKPNSNRARSLVDPRDDGRYNSRERCGRLSVQRFQPTGESLELFF